MSRKTTLWLPKDQQPPWLLPPCFYLQVMPRPFSLETPLGCWEVGRPSPLRLAAWAGQACSGDAALAERAGMQLRHFAQHPPSVSTHPWCPCWTPDFPATQGLAQLERRPTPSSFPVPDAWEALTTDCPPVTASTAASPPTRLLYLHLGVLFLCFSEVESSLGSCTCPDQTGSRQALSKPPSQLGGEKQWLGAGLSTQPPCPRGG